MEAVESKNFPETMTNVIEIEKTLISAMWLKEGRVIPDVAEILTADDFYRPEHRIIYTTTLKVYEDEGVFNFLSLLDELQKAKQLERVGRKYVFALTDYEFTTSRAVKYAKIIREKAQKRALIELGKELTYNASDDVMSIEQLMTFVDEKLQATQSREAKTLKEHGERLISRWEEMERRAKTPNGALGISTGLHLLDRIIRGLVDSDLLVLAARPGMGKTALALNVAMAAAKQVPTLMFSLEMSEEQLSDREICAAGKISSTKFQNGTLTEIERVAAMNAITELESMPLFIDDTGGLTLSEIRMRARNFRRKQGLGLIVVDYIQLIKSDKNKENRVQEVSEISRGLKTLAKELDVPILALSQLSRSVELRAEKRPQLSDLRESGSIEQDADIVMFLYREGYYERDDADKKNIAELIIAKNRNGATGSIRLFFEPEYQFFGDLTREG